MRKQITSKVRIEARKAVQSEMKNLYARQKALGLSDIRVARYIGISRPYIARLRKGGKWENVKAYTLFAFRECILHFEQNLKE